jgi:hypothetical protein
MLVRLYISKECQTKSKHTDIFCKTNGITLSIGWNSAKNRFSFRMCGASPLTLFVAPSADFSTADNSSYGIQQDSDHYRGIYAELKI